MDSLGGNLLQTDLIIPQKTADKQVGVATKKLQEPALRVMTTLTELTELADQWELLETTAKGNVLFQSFAWARTLLETPSVSQSVKIFALFDQAELIALLPLRLEQQRFLRVLTGFAEPFQQYTDMLYNQAYAPADLLKFLTPHLQQVGADLIHLRQVREGGALFQYARTHFTPTGEEEGAPWLDLSQWKSFEDYLKSISARSRKTIRNQRNRLHKTAGLSHRVVRQDEIDLEAMVLSTLSGRENWVETMGYSSRALEGKGLRDFLAHWLKRPPDGCELIAFELKHGDVVISTEWGFLFKDCYSAYMADWNPDYEQSSPGKLHQIDVIEACFALGIDKIDFLKPTSRYKMTWTSEVAPVLDFATPLTFKGTVYCWLWLERLRPLAKKTVLAMPVELRRQLVSFAKRLFG